MMPVGAEQVGDDFRGITICSISRNYALNKPLSSLYFAEINFTLDTHVYSCKVLCVSANFSGVLFPSHFKSGV